jgi:hypothetical protein
LLSAAEGLQQCGLAYTGFSVHEDESSRSGGSFAQGSNEQIQGVVPFEQRRCL